MKALEPDTCYRFRISAINKFGQSPYSWASVEVRSKKTDTGILNIDVETKKILLRSRQAATKPSPDHSPDESRESSLFRKSKTPSHPAQDKDSLSLLSNHDRKSKTPLSGMERKTPVSENGSERGREVMQEKEAPLFENANPLEKYKFTSQLWRSV